MKRLLIFSLIIFLLAGIALSGKKRSGESALPLEPDEFMWHFGMVPKDAWVSHHFALTNTHKDTITITKIDADCDCTYTPRTPVSVPPGETYLMKVLFDTRTYFGETNRNILIVTDYKPSPEMPVYFTSLAARRPNTITVSPRSTAFIPGKDTQKFTIENLSDEKTQFKIYIDSDSVFTVSETEFTIKGKQESDITVFPIWDRIPNGSHHSCLVLEASRGEAFRVTIPIKINKY
jgi:hypothetical protein